MVLRAYSAGHDAFYVFGTGQPWLPDFVAFLEDSLK